MIPKKRLMLIAAFLVIMRYCTAPVLAYGQKTPVAVEITAKEVQYNLAYPGILPDNPIYFIKELRNSAWVFFTRDPIKKAELLLLFSDKKAHAALLLSQKGKPELAIDTMIKGEQEFLQSTTSMQQAKKQGSSPTGDFILKSKLSNEKHREITEDLLKEAPRGQIIRLQAILFTNKKAEQVLKKF